MKLWTVQHKEVLNTILMYGSFQPDFTQSRYVVENPNLSKIYNITLDSFNHVNQTNYQGLVFTFSGIMKNQIYNFDNYNSFKTCMLENMSAIYSLWKHIATEDSTIMELEYPDDKFNPNYIDINDFQYVMPPVSPILPFTDESEEQIYRSMYLGQPRVSEYPSGIAQGHAPYITKENIINLYDIF